MLILFRALRKLGYLLASPKRKLPFFYWATVKFNLSESELKYIDVIAKGNKVSIDIGSNIGLYSYRLAQIFSKVYSFEINPEMSKDLKTYNSEKVEVICVGLSSRIEHTTLYIPVAKNQELTGWAALDPKNYPNPDWCIEKKVLVSTLDSYNMQEVEFIKIDVEGHEVEVLKGALNTIVSNRPTLLIEIKEDNLSKVKSFFSTLNYLQTKLENLIEITGTPENYIFIPAEKQSEYLSSRRR